MIRKNYTIILYSVMGIVVVFFIAFRFFNVSIERQLKVQMRKEIEGSIPQELKVTRQEELKEEKRITETNALTPYTIKVQKQSMLLQDQRYWDSNTKAALEGTDVIQRMDEADVFAGDKMTSEQFDDQIRRIDGRIYEYAQKVQNNPADDHARKKLESLYMLKATVSGLKKVVVEK